MGDGDNSSIIDWGRSDSKSLKIMCFLLATLSLYTHWNNFSLYNVHRNQRNSLKLYQKLSETKIWTIETSIQWRMDDLYQFNKFHGPIVCGELIL